MKEKEFKAIIVHYFWNLKKGQLNEF